MGGRSIKEKFRCLWRKHIRPWWCDYQWPVVGGLGIFALILGYIGFWKYFQVKSPKNFWDLFYLAIQLFPLQSGALDGSVGWELGLARLLAPAVTAFTAAKVLAAIFYQQFLRVRLLFMEGHIIICGLGRKGLFLAKGFHEQGHQVVVIDKEGENSLFEDCRDENMILLIGNATHEEVLRKARVHKARYFFSVMGDDGANVEVAVRVGEMMKPEQGAFLESKVSNSQPAREGVAKTLNCFIHLADPELCLLLREREFFAEHIPSFRMEFFNIYNTAARFLLGDYMADYGKLQESLSLKEYQTLYGRGWTKNQPVLLIVGIGRMGQSLIVHAARRWQDRFKETGEKLRVTMVDIEANLKKQLLCLLYPQIEKICDLLTIDMDINSTEFRKGEFLIESGDCPITNIYICLNNDSKNLVTALRLLKKTRAYEIPIMLMMDHETGFATLLRGIEVSASGIDCIRSFGVLDHACRPELVQYGIHETLAQAIHEDYVRDQMASGETPQTRPYLTPWENLPEEYKDSNRRQADHISIKLNDIKCYMAPLTDWNAPSFQFTQDEIERLAKMEHDRWLDEKKQAGWTSGKRSDEMKTHPDMVEWEKLVDKEKEIDRNFIKGLPAFLANIDLQIYRKKENPKLTSRYRPGPNH